MIAVEEKKFFEKRVKEKDIKIKKLEAKVSELQRLAERTNADLLQSKKDG